MNESAPQFRMVDRSRTALRQTDYDRDAVVENLQAQLAAAKEQIAEMQDEFNRLLADFTESEKRREF